MNTIHLWIEEPIISGPSITLSAMIEIKGEGRKKLWYRIPARTYRRTTRSADPFVLGSIFTVMRRGGDLKVHSEVSPSILRNLEKFQTVWSTWRRGIYRRIEIHAATEREPQQTSTNAAIGMFSGGVDSSFTFYRHREEPQQKWKRPLKAGVMVHGFDIPLEEEDTFTYAFGKARSVLNSIGMDLIPVATNFRELGDVWGDAFGAALASTLSLFQSGFREGLISSSDPYDALLLPYGSNPLTDVLLSSDNFAISNYGGAFNRIEKVRAVAQWPEALENLYVCWQGPKKGRNCGVCEKCIRTILNFRLVRQGLPQCFEKDITDDQIESIRGLRPAQLVEFEHILSSARQAGISASWVSAVERCVKRNRRGMTSHNSPLLKIRRRISVRKRLHEAWSFIQAASPAKERREVR